MSSEISEPRPFIELGDYERPSMPTKEAARKVWDNLRARLDLHEDNKPTIALSEMKRVSPEELETLPHAPDCAPLMAELESELKDWSSKDQWRNLKLVVLPPCEEKGILGNWAVKNGHTLIAPPSSEQILGKVPWEIPDPLLANSGRKEEEIIVIANLEEWFFRHIQGLKIVRQLLVHISQFDGRCVIGCNSWAYRFLTKACDASVVLPTPRTFQSFDSERLREWFLQILRSEEGQLPAIRLQENGSDLFDQEAEESSEFFRHLAAQSFGIPWVAWQLWRESLRTANLDKDNENGTIEKDAFWIALPADYPFPDVAKPAALLVLHALLIHGRLTLDELAMVTPKLESTNIAIALRKNGLIKLNPDATLSCCAFAYPSIRNSLSSSGFPIAKM